MSGFVGRRQELAALIAYWRGCAQAGGPGAPAGLPLMRGCRRVGKSRLVEEFVERVGVPSPYFTASAQPTREADLRLFVEAAASSDLPGAAALRISSRTPGMLR